MKTRYTKNIKVAMYLVECEHEAELVANQPEVYCHSCKAIIEPKFIGNILVSLSKDGTLTAKAPLPVRAETPSQARVTARSQWPGE